MNKDLFTVKRKSFTELDKIYFWTATINNWQRLLQDDSYKDIIISSLEHLSEQEKIDVFAFVIMPNHVHFIWRIKENNGKESAVGSFLKFTAHEFKNELQKNNAEGLLNYKVKASNKGHEFWQRDPLAIQLYSAEVAWQKFDYLHANPVSERWQLVDEPWDYKYSTAKFYEKGIKEFKFIKDLRDEF